MTRVHLWDKNLAGKIHGELPKRNWVKHKWGQSDDRVFKKAGRHLGLMETRWNGQEHRVRRQINGLMVIVAIGNGRLTWLQVILERTWMVLPGKRNA